MALAVTEQSRRLASH